jgi:hypothetical protein
MSSSNGSSGSSKRYEQELASACQYEPLPRCAD